MLSGSGVVETIHPSWPPTLTPTITITLAWRDSYIPSRSKNHEIIQLGNGFHPMIAEVKEISSLIKIN